MHPRRFASLLLGFWIGLSMAMLFVATRNLSGVDLILEAPTPAASRVIDRLGPEAARQFLRHQVSELNRHYFEVYGWAQVALALALGITLLFATQASRWMLAVSACLLFVVCVEQFLLRPEITYLGRLLDYVPGSSPQPARERFWSFHIAYSVFEIVKLGLLAVVGAKLLLSYSSRRRILPAPIDGEMEAARASVGRNDIY